MNTNAVCAQKSMFRNSQTNRKTKSFNVCFPFRLKKYSTISSFKNAYRKTNIFIKSVSCLHNLLLWLEHSDSKRE